MTEDNEFTLKRENSPDREEARESQEAMLVDVAIHKLLGSRTEVAEETIKVWPSHVTNPDETNWITARRWSRSVSDCKSQLDALGIDLSLMQEHSEHWAVVSFRNKGFKMVTTATYSEELAAALGLWCALYVISLGFDNHSRVT